MSENTYSILTLVIPTKRKTIIYSLTQDTMRQTVLQPGPLKCFIKSLIHFPLSNISTTTMAVYILKYLYKIIDKVK